MLQEDISYSVDFQKEYKFYLLVVNAHFLLQWNDVVICRQITSLCQSRYTQMLEMMRVLFFEILLTVSRTVLKL